MTRSDFMLHIHRLNLLLPKGQRCVFSKWRVPWNYVFSPFKNLYLTVRFINNWICWKDCSFGSVRKRSVELSKYEFEYIKAEQTIIKIKFIFLSIYLFWIFFQCLKILHKPVRKTMVPLPLEHNKNIKPKAGFRITVLGYDPSFTGTKGTEQNYLTLNRLGGLNLCTAWGRGVFCAPPPLEKSLRE